MSGVFRIAKNSVLITISRATEMVSSFVMMGMLSRYLGVETFGNYLFIMAIVLTIISFANMGLPALLIREISQNKTLTANFIRSGLILVAIALLGTCLIVLMVAFFLRFSFPFFIALFFGFFSESLVLLSGPFISAFISFEKMEYDAIVTIINRVLLISLLIGIVSLNLGFISVFITLTIVNMVRLLAIIYISNRKIVRLNFHPRGNGVTHLFREVLPIAVSFILSQFYLYTNLFVLKAIRDIKEVSLFQAPFDIILKLQVLPTILLTAFASVMARLAFKDLTYIHLRNIYMPMNKYLFIICLPVQLVGVLLSEKITILIFGADFKPAAISFQILIWIIVFQFLKIFSDHILTVIRKQRLLIISSISAFLANFFLTLIFTYYYGYIGASIAALCSFIFFFILNFYFVSRYIKNISISFTIKPLIALSLIAIILYHFRNWNSVVLIIICSLIYVGLLFILNTFSKSEINLFIRTINEVGDR